MPQRISLLQRSLEIPDGYRPIYPSQIKEAATVVGEIYVMSFCRVEMVWNILKGLHYNSYNRQKYHQNE